MTGITINEYWDMTPNEVLLCLEVHSEKEVKKYQELLFTAWHTVAFDRSKRLPKLDVILKSLNNKRAEKNNVVFDKEKLVWWTERLGLKVPNSLRKENEDG